nr:hypothetical protein [Tanacetum cinerariifolium]
MRSEKAKEKGVAFRDVEEFVRPTTILPTINPKDKGKGIMQEPEKPPKNPRKAQIQLDEELAKRMHEEEMAKLKRMQSEIAAAEEASKAPINQELDDIQAMIEADEQMASKLQSEEQEQFTIEEKSRMLVEMIAERKSKMKDDSSNKQAGSRKKRTGLKFKPKLPKKLKVMKEQESTVDDEKELHQIHLDEEALREILEEEARDKQERDEKIMQKQADDEEFFLEFGMVRYDSENESN